jgi:DNA-directed RNA polymerase subunit RPC12/RpoP
MTYKCPTCGHEFDASALQHPAGMGGGLYCPKCQERVYVSMPYGRAVALISLVISAALLAVLNVKNIVAFVIGTALIWIPVSMFLNLWSTRLKPPSLKKWKQRRRTFFEWLYDKDEPRDLFGKR